MENRMGGGRTYYSHGTSNAKGVMILIGKNAKIKVLRSVKDGNGRFLILKVCIEKGEYLLANIYGSNEDKPEIFRDLMEEMETLEVDQKIIAGDFNFCMDPVIDKQGGNPDTHVQTRQYVMAYMQQHHLIDIWRGQNPQTFQFTWKRLQPSPIFVRLDYIIISEMLQQTVADAYVDPGFKTDHSIPVTSLCFTDMQRGPGFWKFNTSLLEDQIFREQLRKLIDLELAHTRF